MTALGGGGTIWPLTASEVTAVKSLFGGGGIFTFGGGNGTVLGLLVGTV